MRRRPRRRLSLVTAIRVGVVAATAFGLWASSGRVMPLPDPALAQVPAPSAQATAPVATPTSAPSLSPTATAVPTASPTPADSTTAVAARPTAAVSTPTATPVVTDTATPMPPLPPLTDQPDAPGSAVQATIGMAGGRIASADGRVAIDFPAGAAAESVSVQITKRASADTHSPSPDLPFVCGTSTRRPLPVERRSTPSRRTSR